MAVIRAHLAALERYLDPQQRPVAYRSDPVGTRWGGDRYYDDNAWIGLGLIQLERLRPGTAGLDRARELFAFACQGWDQRTGVPAPGGVFWVEQGRGVGRRNHDRNTVSSAPNAQLGLHLALLGAAGDPEIAAAERMIAWVHGSLTAEGGALFRDKIRGDGSIDRALWSYNQGSMAGAELLRHRLGRDGALARAQAIARAVLAWPPERLRSQPPAFNAILLRNLLGVAGAGGDSALARLGQRAASRLRPLAACTAARPPRPDLRTRPSPQRAGSERAGVRARAARLGSERLRAPGLTGGAPGCAVGGEPSALLCSTALSRAGGVRDRGCDPDGSGSDRWVAPRLRFCGVTA